MGEIIVPRRSFLLGSLSTLFVAPAIIRSSALMPVKAFANAVNPLLDFSDFQAQFKDFQKRFLAEYRKSPDAEAAKNYDIFGFGSKWAGVEKFRTEAAMAYPSVYLPGRDF